MCITFVWIIKEPRISGRKYINRRSCRTNGVLEYFIGNLTNHIHLGTIGFEIKPIRVVILGANIEIDRVVDSVNFYIGAQDNYPYGLYFKPDGTKMYMIGEVADKVFQYSIGTTTPTVNIFSATDAGFLDYPDEGDTHPFTSGTPVDYTVQTADKLSSGTYYWRARAIDPSVSYTHL